MHRLNGSLQCWLFDRLQNQVIMKPYNSSLLTCIIKYVVAFVLLSLPIFGNANIKSDQGSKIVFRFDDFQLISSTFYDSLLYTFKKNKIPICLGTIPFDKNGLFHNELNYKQLNSFKTSIKNNEIEIALHGYDHKDNELKKGSFLKSPIESEFSKLSYKAQFTRLKIAKESIDSLLGINVNIFIPPYNTYDDNTLKVLDTLKFEIISANIYGPSRSNKIKYIPFTINDLNELQKVIRKHQNHKISIIVMMHSFSFKGGSNYVGDYAKPMDFKQLDALLHWIRNQYYIEATTFSALNQGEIFDNKRFDLNSLDNNLLFKALKKIGIYRYGVYNTSEYITRYKGTFAILNALFHILTFLFFYWITKILAKMIKPSKTIILLLFSSMVIILLLFIYIKSNSDSLFALCALIITVFGAILSGTSSIIKSAVKT
jgi:predicted deacetylase